jgi:molybdenum cofactor cytidylyltransferase
MNEPARIGAVILAAGQSSRYRAADPTASSKVVAALAGKPLVRHVAEAALAAGLDPVIVVTGHAREETQAALSGLPVRFLHNSAFATGLASSLKQGVAALPLDCAGAAILLGDMPLVNAQILRGLAAAFAANPGASAVAPIYEGVRGNPVLIRSSLFDEVARLQGDVGARKLLQGRADVLDVAIDDAGVAIDIDTPEALTRLRG